MKQDQGLEPNEFYDFVSRRIYINLTNKCNIKCPFCFMYSSPNNTIDMPFEKFKDIIQNTITDKCFEVQLGGGETTLYPQFLAAVEYCLTHPLVTTVLIDTNGRTLDQWLPVLNDLTLKYNKKIILKISVNYYLVQLNPKYVKNLHDLLYPYHENKLLNFFLSIRTRQPISLDQNFLEEIQQDEYLSSLSHILVFLEYTGRARDLKIPNLILSNNISPKIHLSTIFATDGTCFGEDWNGRQEHEKAIAKDPI